VPRDKAPTGKEISEKAKKAKLDRAKEGVGEKDGKKSKLTLAQLDDVNSPEDLEEGQFIGELDTEVPGDRAGLPPGKYNMFIAKVGDEWKVYAESGGEIAAEAVNVTERGDAPDDEKPKFREGSFCWWVWLIFIGFEWCF
jgi:hypothetical protein